MLWSMAYFVMVSDWFCGNIADAPLTTERTALRDEGMGSGWWEVLAFRRDVKR